MKTYKKKKLTACVLTALLLGTSLGVAQAKNVIGTGDTIKDGDTYDYFYGFQNKNGDANGYTVTMNGGTIKKDVYGGCTEAGNAEYNTLIIKGGEVKETAYGGYTKNGNTINNTVTLIGGTVGYNIIGGESDKSGQANNNTVNIKGGTLNGVLTGALGNDGASGNTVNIYAGTTKEEIRAGYAVSGLSTENTLNIYGGTLCNLIEAGQSNSSANVVSNHVNVYNGTLFCTITGGYAYKGDSTDNTVDIVNGTITSGNVRGGFSSYGNVTKNVITITGGEVNTYHTSYDYNGNHYDYYHGGNVIGGVAQKGTATDNTVDISGGKITRHVCGGAAIEDNATKNTVNISGGEIAGNIYGGAYYYYDDLEEGGPTSEDLDFVTDNTLNVSNNVSLSNALYNFDYVNLDSASLSGNVLSTVNHITARSGANNAISDLSGEIKSLSVAEGAALGVSDSDSLGIGALNNDGTLTLVDNVSASSFTAGAGSLLVVDGAKVLSTAAISGLTDSVSIDSTARLLIDNAKKDETYHILAGSAVTAKTGYQESNLLHNAAASSSLLTLKLVNDQHDGAYNVKAVLQSARDAFGSDVIIPDAVDKATADSDSTAADFFNTAADIKSHATKQGQAAAINSAAELGALAGLAHGTYRAASLMTDAYTDHLSRDVHPEQGRDLWAVYTHSKDTVGGMNLAGGIAADYELQLNGVVVGSDLYQSGTATAGIALSYADGSTSGWNGIARTKNDADYYGLSLYGRKDCGSMSYLGDITYLHGNNDLTQFNSGKRITADADTDAFSVGLTAQREYQAGKGRLTPYAGLRYVKLGTGSYTDSLGLKHDADDQDLLVLPVGIKYAADITDPCGWTWRPTVEAGYVWNLGDRDTNERVSYHSAGNTFGYNTLDSSHLVLKLGIQAEKDNLTYGLAYEHQNGDTTEANIFKADVKISF